MSRKNKKVLIRLIITLVLLILLLILDSTLNLKDNLKNYILLSGYIIGYAIISYDIIIKAIKNIVKGDIFDENLLMIIATIGAFIIKSYLEAIAVMLLYQIGEMFQRYAVNKSRKSIMDLMDIRPDYANLKKDDKVEVVYPDEVNIDDVIVVYPGEKIPLDGIIISGSSTLDTKSLTGESIPLDVFEGNEVLSGSINLTKTIEIKVNKDFYDSTASKILDLVENASSLKSKSENFITKFARFYTPIVVILAVLLATLGGLFTKEYKGWIYSALNFLVVSCPCALVISVPLTFFCALGVASKQGILIKGSNYIEKLNSSKTFVFDKTGTLTKGVFEVSDIYPQDKKDEILTLAATAEKDSNHPIAKSILKLAKPLDGYTLEEVAGKGIISRKDNDIIYCGNEKLLTDNNIEFVKNEGIGTVVYVARNSEFIGSIIISDTLKDETIEVMDKLNHTNTIMLTGDNEEVASYISMKCKIKKHYSSLLPQDKVKILNEILNQKEENDNVTFVGDGINDAPALIMSDIGISMGQIGSDAAIEASDIVLMKDDLKGILKAKKIACKTMKIVRQNIVFSIGIKVLVMILAVLSLSNMWLAIFADVGVAVIAILNAMRVSRIN